MLTVATARVARFRSGLPGLHVIGVERTEAGLRVDVESERPRVVGVACVRGDGPRACVADDRADRRPCFSPPVRLSWRKRRWRCPEPICPVVTFTEQDVEVAPPRGQLTCRATGWANGQLRRENASMQGLARQLGCTWKTLWRSVRPVLEAADDDEDRFVGVTRLGSTSMSGITPRPSPSTRAGGTRKSSPAWSI